MRKNFLGVMLPALAGVVILGIYYHWVWWLLVLIGPVWIIALIDMLQKKHAIMRNYPVLGRLRYLMEDLRPKIYQYFVESDTDGQPINRVNRSTIYQRAKRELDTQPFGTQFNVYSEGYEWLAHSINPTDFHQLNKDPRLVFGDGTCSQPYSASILNISAMSYGSLSAHAVEALNAGARIGHFAHNTGEGGLSPYHLKHGGDIIWQLGTGYFGCRDEQGNFSPDLFSENAACPQVKMIEIKLSQGAKPGHGGILPAAKNTPEIAQIRHVRPYTTVYSPTFHTAFTSPRGLLEFVAKLRGLSGGKPVGFKLCIGREGEFFSICKAMLETGIHPDFITVDGGEGGTGAAPPEFSNSVGMPFMDGLAFVHDSLRGFGLRDKTRVIASGKILTGFHIVRAMALGADACNSARAMMLALGCIQALLCNTNKCPTGVTTQDPWKMKGLVVEDKKQRVANYHQDTVESCVELIAAAGLTDPSQVHRGLLYRRVFMDAVKSFREIYPDVEPGSYLKGVAPEPLRRELSEAKVDTWH